MNLLLTRPKKQAASMAEALRRRGHLVYLAPLLRVERLHHDRAKLEQASAVIVTSANAVPALVGLDPAVQVFAVGPETAAAAGEAGLRNVAAASGTAESLLEVISCNWWPDNGPIVYASGRHISVDVSSRLASLGYRCERVEVYAAEQSRNLPDTAHSLLRRGVLDAALFMSVRTAGAFAELVANAGLAERCRTVVSVVLSRKIADRIQHLPWQETSVAASPTRAGILGAIDALEQRYRTIVQKDAV